MWRKLERTSFTLWGAGWVTIFQNHVYRPVSTHCQIAAIDRVWTGDEANSDEIRPHWWSVIFQRWAPIEWQLAWRRKGCLCFCFVQNKRKLTLCFLLICQVTIVCILYPLCHCVQCCTKNSKQQSEIQAVILTRWGVVMVWFIVFQHFNICHWSSFWNSTGSIYSYLSWGHGVT